MQEQLVVVNKKDKVIGIESRKVCHLGRGLLHRAVTIFIFDEKGNLLITRRSKQKLLWSNIWEASCSTHVYKNENYEQAGIRRLPQELGFSCELESAFIFKYQKLYKNVGSENEICTLLIGRYNGKVDFNQKEISDYKWISLNKLWKDIERCSQKYAPWLKIAVKKYLDYKINQKIRKIYD